MVRRKCVLAGDEHKTTGQGGTYVPLTLPGCLAVLPRCPRTRGPSIWCQVQGIDSREYLLFVASESEKNT